jgi:hypothetical protein
MDDLVIYVGRQGNGVVFRLSPRSERALGACFPERIQTAQSLFVRYEDGRAFEDVRGFLAEHVAALLTGLSPQDMQRAGGVRFVDPNTDETLHRLQPHHA